MTAQNYHFRNLFNEQIGILSGLSLSVVKRIRICLGQIRTFAKWLTPELRTYIELVCTRTAILVAYLCYPPHLYLAKFYWIFRKKIKSLFLQEASCDPQSPVLLSA